MAGKQWSAEKRVLHVKAVSVVDLNTLLATTM